MHIQQPIHFSESIIILPVLSSFDIAPLLQAKRQSASSQCKHLTGMQWLTVEKTETLFIGSGNSFIAENNSLLDECSTPQAISQLLHPRHLCKLRYIFFILIHYRIKLQSISFLINMVYNQFCCFNGVLFKCK